MQETNLKKNILFERIQYEDIDPFISFLTDVRPDYPYRWFFDPHWISDRIEDPTYVWGVMRDEERIIGTVICYYDSSKQISILKLLLVRPEYRGQGLLNTILFNRLQEQRVIDQIRVNAPNLLFAEIVVNQLTSQKMVRRMGMAFCGYHSQKTIIDGVRADLIPCILPFKTSKHNIKVDDRFADRVITLLHINGLHKLCTVERGRESVSPSEVTQIPLKVSKQSNFSGEEEWIICVNDSTLTFDLNIYLRSIVNARIQTTDWNIADQFIGILGKWDVFYTEVLATPDLCLQDLLIRHGFQFTAYLPFFWKGDDVLVFSKWKNQSLLTPEAQQVYACIMIDDSKNSNGE